MKLELDPEQSASLTILTPDGAQTQSPAHILSTSGRRMTVVAEVIAPVGTPVKVQWSQYLVLAEILSVQELTRTLSLQIRHVLRTEDIEHIRQRWA
jgi:hypothetical protein